MTQEALKLSQEALAGLKDVEKQVRELVAENKALKEALAQTQEPKPLPQGWNVVEVVGNITKVWHMTEEQITSFSLAEQPPQRTWVGLTDEEIDFHLDKILRAAGTALKHYSMQKTKDDMRQALREVFV